MSIKDLNHNLAKPMLADVFVFELKDNKMKLLSIAFESIEDANSFIETMKEGMYYKSMRPDAILIAMQVLNIC